MKNKLYSVLMQCAAAAVMLLCVLLLGCGKAHEGNEPTETEPAAATEAASTEPTEEPLPTAEPTALPTIPAEAATGYSRYGRSGRIPDRLGPELYYDYCRLMDCLYECGEEVQLAYCSTAEDFAAVSSCIELMFIPKDLLRDPSFLTVTPFDFDPDTRLVRISYWWDDMTLEPEDMRCTCREEYLEKLSEFEAIVEGILAECVSDPAADEENALALFTWTADNLYYEINRGDSAYTAFLNHRAYCSIYAEVYQFLAEEAGVECMRVSGATQAAWGDHEWDLVRLNGCWYHADATAQGSDNYAEGYYFGMSDAMCVKLGYGSVADFALSDELGRGSERPECNDMTYDMRYRSWLIGG